MKKILFLLYGLMAYIIFLTTFCYGVGFVSTAIVPKHLDSVPRSPLSYALFINAILLVLFALQHSTIVRRAFGRWWTKIAPKPIQRSTNILLASLCMIVLFEYWQPIRGVVWQADSESIQLFLKLLCLFGFGIVVVSTFLINHFDLFGLRQVWLYFIGKKYEPLPFRTLLYYTYIRRPLYLGFIIAFWSTPTMTIGHLFFAVMTTGYMLAAIQFEESDSCKQLGQKYLEPKKSAPMIIPFLKAADKVKINSQSSADGKA